MERESVRLRGSCGGSARQHHASPNPLFNVSREVREVSTTSARNSVDDVGRRAAHGAAIGMPGKQAGGHVRGMGHRAGAVADPAPLLQRPGVRLGGETMNEKHDADAKGCVMLCSLVGFRLAIVAGNAIAARLELVVDTGAPGTTPQYVQIVMHPMQAIQFANDLRAVAQYIVDVDQSSHGLPQ